MTAETPAHYQARSGPTIAGVALYVAASAALIGGLILFYTYVYSLHTDLAGLILSSRLADTLGASFGQYSSYFPPAERAWYTLGVWLSDATGLRPDLASIALTGGAILVSTGLAYHIRRMTVGASPLFLIGSVAMLVALPILFKNVFGLREHIVVLGLWPYLVLRLGDPDDTRIGWRTRAVVGVWLGATLMLKYLYALVVLLIELVDLAVQHRPLTLFRIENLISGGMVALYLFVWLVLDPAQREVIGTMVSALDANLADPWAIARQAAIAMALAVFLVILAWLYKLSMRDTAFGLVMVVSAIAVAWIQGRWYSHHLFPVTLAYIAWLWMVGRNLKPLFVIAIVLVIARPALGEFLSSAKYQDSVSALDRAMAKSGVAVKGKRVGLLNMHPAPFGQYLAMHGAQRWVGTVNNAYVAAEMEPLDVAENAGKPLPPVKLEDAGFRMLHDQMLQLWEDLPPDLLILDESTSWPLRNVSVQWTQAFANEPRFKAIINDYRPVYHYENKSEELDFTVYVRAQ